MEYQLNEGFPGTLGSTPTARYPRLHHDENRTKKLIYEIYIPKYSTWDEFRGIVGCNTL